MDPSNGALSQGMDKVWDTGDRLGQEWCVDWGPPNGPFQWGLVPGYGQGVGHRGQVWTGMVVLIGGLQINLSSKLLSQGMDRVWDTGDRMGQEGCVDWGPVNGPL